VHEDVTLSTVTGAMDMFIHTNRLFEQSGKPKPFKIVVAVEKKDKDVLLIPSQFVSYETLAEVTKPDLIVVPAFYGDRDDSLKKHKKIIEWINNRYQNGAEVASMCSGIYFLAEAGLLP